MADLTGDREILDPNENPFSDEVMKWMKIRSAKGLQPLRDDPALLANVRSELTWGTYGKDADKPLKLRFLNDLETSHLENILITERHIKPVYSLVILDILKERYSPSLRVDKYLEDSK